jgi:citrate lyase subunit beta/citryl-CoA lyase
MVYEGKMLIHPNQIEPSNRRYAPSAEDVEWARGVLKTFEEEGLARGAAPISYKGKLVDTPVYDKARTILAIWMRSRHLTRSARATSFD